MVYRWDDLQNNHLEVEWGENIHRTRRTRALGVYGPTTKKRSNWLSATIVGVSTLAAIGIATMVALTLTKSPIIPKREGAPSNAEGIDSLLVLVVPEASTPSPMYDPSAQPTAQPTGRPTLRPTTAWPTVPPTVAESHMPSLMASALPSIASSDDPSDSPSMSPSGVPKAPPAPEPVLCVDQPGFFHNHAGDKVSCDWFSTVGTYNFHKNCEKTAVGKACLFTCEEYNDCIVPVVATDPPSYRPSSFPSSSIPTVNPTPQPPKSITLETTGDASIKQAVPNANLGSASWLKIDAAPLPLPQDSPHSSTNSGAFHVLLRFDLSKHDSTRPVESAVLRLKAANSCSSGGYLQRTHSPHWDENVVTWDTAPEGDGTEIGRLGSIKSGYWYSVDVTSALHSGHEALSLRLYPVGSDECLFVSKENSSGGGPELHIDYVDV
mmetsp:Transcript_36384/g.65502  ORF Transcript_36384/g.65502 Transcript_36384/m.65502 type:complete len:436 (+) Transcript_36384:128-1435(+)